MQIIYTNQLPETVPDMETQPRPHTLRMTTMLSSEERWWPASSHPQTTHSPPPRSGDWRNSSWIFSSLFEINHTCTSMDFHCHLHLHLHQHQISINFKWNIYFGTWAVCCCWSDPKPRCSLEHRHFTIGVMSLALQLCCVVHAIEFMIVFAKILFQVVLFLISCNVIGQ